MSKKEERIFYGPLIKEGIITNVKEFSKGVQAVYHVEDGEPLRTDQDIVSIEPTGEHGHCGQSVLVETIRRGSGPARATNAQWRANWDSTFGGGDSGNETIH